MFKNPYKNFAILFLGFILYCLNNYFTGFRPWFIYLEIIFPYLLYLIIILIFINAIYFLKKNYLLGILEILLTSFLGLFLLLISRLDTSSLIEYINFGSDYKIKIEYSEENNSYYFIQKDRLLYFFSKNHCIYSYRDAPNVNDWEKIDKNNIRIRGKVFTLKKALLLTTPACTEYYN